MAFSQISTDRPADAAIKAASAPWLERVVQIALPLAALLLWTCVVRLPFYTATDKDEFFFSVIAAQWLNGGLPYVATFDLKPPGLFFIYAVAQSLFGASQAMIKSMEIVAIALGAYGLYAMLRARGAQAVGLWCAILFPVYTLTLGGIIAVNMILQLPLLIWAFASALSAIGDGTVATRLRQAFLAGLAVGAAGMVKQTALFEAIGIFAILCIYGAAGLRIRMVALYALGTALPAAAFAAYFLWAGHFSEMFEAVVVLALLRADSDVALSYGPELAQYLTLPGAFLNGILTSVLLYFLWGSAIFALVRLDRIRKAFPTRLLVVAAIWFAAAFAGAVAGRVICTYYLLTTIPPLLIVAGALYCHGLDVAPEKRRRAFVLSLLAAVASLLYLDRDGLLMPNTFLAGDFHATREVSQQIRDLGLGPDDRLLVLNRGYGVYTETGALPPTPYFHATHLLGVFHTPVADPLGETLAANPRFIVIADPETRHITELASRYLQALDYVGKHYRVAAVVEGERDSFTIYEFLR